MATPIWVVDSFTDAPFGGNPAAVCILDEAAPERWMQRVAAEMRHSETAFLAPRADGDWDLRWFTPAREVDLCGHATLASAHVLWEEGRAGDDDPLRFHTRSGPLLCTRAPDGAVAMRFPAAPAAPLAPSDVPDGLFAALGIPAVPVHEAANGNLLLELPDAAAVQAVEPDFRALLAVSGKHGYILTAPAPAQDAADAVCRYFVPAWGIDEDPATGSIQCTLGPHWCQRLGVEEVLVRQTSARGALLRARPEGTHVVVTGRATTVLAGSLAPQPQQ